MEAAQFRGERTTGVRRGGKDHHTRMTQQTKGQPAQGFRMNTMITKVEWSHGQGERDGVGKQGKMDRAQH
eukprot:4011557-Heterocapsa_arctica.AAC.1